jgi:hypothetical protein
MLINLCKLVIFKGKTKSLIEEMFFDDEALIKFYIIYLIY